MNGGAGADTRECRPELAWASGEPPEANDTHKGSIVGMERPPVDKNCLGLARWSFFSFREPCRCLNISGAHTLGKSVGGRR